MIYNKEQIDLYLKKMEYNDEIKIDYETLCKLQIAHLTHIPYENIDVLNRKPVSLEAQDLFDKMIVKARGGYCFELNGLYSNLLKSLGFNVTNLAGRFIYQDGNTRMRLHRILKIDIDDKDKKLLYRTFKDNKKMLRALNIKKKDFKIDILDAVEEALAYSYK